MAVATDQFDPTDPYAMVRRRVTNQMAGGGDAPPLETPTGDPSTPIPPAEFTPPASPTTPTTPIVPLGDRETPTPIVTPPTPPDTPTTPTTPTGPAAGVVTPGFRDQVTQAYQQILHRAPTEAELYNHAQNPGGIDAVIAELRAANPATTGGAGGTTTRPTGGSLSDPNYVRQLIAWAATQPGVNPSVKNDPNYWLNAVSRFGTDEGYFVQRMFTPEGPAEGARTAGGTGVTAPTMLGAGGGLLGNYGLQQPQGLWSPDFVATLRQLIQERLKGASQPVDPNDPNINIPVTAARDQLTRQGETERSALAEHAYAQGGLNTDLIGRQIQQSNERSGQTLGNIRAQLIQREIVSRRSELQDLLSMVMAAGDSQAARSIQLQIAALNAQLTEQNQGINLAEFGAQLNSNAAIAGLRG